MPGGKLRKVLTKSVVRSPISNRSRYASKRLAWSEPRFNSKSVNTSHFESELISHSISQRVVCNRALARSGKSERRHLRSDGPAHEMSFSESVSEKNERLYEEKEQDDSSYSPIKTRGLIRKEVKEADRCRICKGDAGCLMNCISCHSKYHLECLGYTHESSVLISRKRSGDWLCSMCIPCSTCGDFIYDPENIQCFSCDRAFHGKCRPRNTATPTYPLIRWSCEFCSPRSPVKAKPKDDEFTSTAVPVVHDSNTNIRKPPARNRLRLQNSFPTAFWSSLQIQRDEINDQLKDECRANFVQKSHEKREERRLRVKEGSISPKRRLTSPQKLRKPKRSQSREEENIIYQLELMDNAASESAEEKEERKVLEKKMLLLKKEQRMREISTSFDYNLYQKAKTEWLTKKREFSNLSGGDDPDAQWVHFGFENLLLALYPSPYPKHIISSPHIYVCRFCLTALETSTKYEIHTNSCFWQFPPGNEIYREGGISFWEVDGDIEKAYCRRLCLLSKLFLSSKTLHHEVETFLFYVLTENTDEGCVLLAYFSKEKNPSKNNNLSCLLTLPAAQRTGYGRFLIDLSYKLSIRERKIGSPEHPLSDLGLITYRSYWKAVIISYLRKYRSHTTLSIKDMSLETAIHPSDIISTLLANKMLRYNNGNYMLNMKKAVIAPLCNFRRRVVHDDLLIWEPEFDVDSDPLKMGNYVA